LYANGKHFARKLIRAFAEITDEDVKNEVRAINKLSGESQHPNLVHILRYGNMVNSPTYYFIDMELCDMDLDTYIRQNFPFSFPPPASTDSDIDLSSETILRCIKKILKDIVAGVLYIHAKGEVHRDLKPRNGILQ
jgi:serine/threonine protein kinase